MKLKILLASSALFFVAGTLFAANGDLIVNGNLGVGTSTPSTRAEIDGNLKVNGTVANSGETVNGNSSVTGNATVNGILNVGASGIRFSDNSVQTTAKRLVWDYLVTAATTSVTSPTLDGNADGGYEFEFIIYNSTAGSVSYAMYVENDKIPSNYRADASGGWLATADIANNTPAGYERHMTGNLVISPRGYCTATYQRINVASSSGAYFGKWRKYASITNLTRIDIVASEPYGIGVGSRFRLWRRK